MYEWLEQSAQTTEWSVWVRRVVSAARQAEISRDPAWESLVPLSANTSAMRWLVGQIRRCHPEPPGDPRQEASLYVLAACCPDNRVLGYVIDTFLYYFRTGNSRGVLSCIRILSLVDRGGAYSHLNVFYNVVMGCVLRELRRSEADTGEYGGSSFLSARDFRIIGRCLPDFRQIGLRERLQMLRPRITGTTTSEQLARECCMSGSVFRRRFKQEFGLPVSEWLRRLRKERIERMLRDPGIPLWQVAEDNGFNMPSTFADYCRRNFGESPRRMRERITGQ